ncbi:unnamed protein product [[Candida] boidinii]|nr:unnamed protein product [[Candida] boidinii]
MEDLLKSQQLQKLQYQYKSTTSSSSPPSTTSKAGNSSAKSSTTTSGKNSGKDGANSTATTSIQAQLAANREQFEFIW